MQSPIAATCCLRPRLGGLCARASHTGTAGELSQQQDAKDTGHLNILWTLDRVPEWKVSQWDMEKALIFS